VNTKELSDIAVSGLSKPNVPLAYELIGAYPNPFNPSTKVVYEIAEKADVLIEVYDILGIKVRTLLREQVEAGRREVIWDCLNDQGRAVSSGQYICRMTTGSFTKSIRLILVK
jgi:hypothetical protein